jgi:hypothetical protein
MSINQAPGGGVKGGAWRKGRDMRSESREASGELELCHQWEESASSHRERTTTKKLFGKGKNLELENRIRVAAADALDQRADRVVMGVPSLSRFGYRTHAVLFSVCRSGYPR